MTGVAGRIALTGGIASGKSAVADLLAARGAVIIDSDVLAREVVEPGTPGLAAISERFGAGVLAGAGSRARGADEELMTRLVKLTQRVIVGRVGRWLT